MCRAFPIQLSPSVERAQAVVDACPEADLVQTWAVQVTPSNTLPTLPCICTQGYAMSIVNCTHGCGDLSMVMLPTRYRQGRGSAVQADSTCMTSMQSPSSTVLQDSRTLNDRSRPIPAEACLAAALYNTCYAVQAAADGSLIVLIQKLRSQPQILTAYARDAEIRDAKVAQELVLLLQELKVAAHMLQQCSVMQYLTRTEGCGAANKGQ